MLSYILRPIDVSRGCLPPQYVLSLFMSQVGGTNVSVAQVGGMQGLDWRGGMHGDAQVGGMQGLDWRGGMHGDLTDCVRGMDNKLVCVGGQG